jgi:hypothetical protein
MNAFPIVANVVAFPILDNKVGGMYFKLTQLANVFAILATSGRLMFGAFCKLKQFSKLGVKEVPA